MRSEHPIHSHLRSLSTYMFARSHLESSGFCIRAMTAAPHMQCLLEVVAAADRDLLSTGAADLAEQQGVAPPVLHSLVQGSVVPSVEAAAADVTDEEGDLDLYPDLEWPLPVDMYPYDKDTEPPSPVDMLSIAASTSSDRPAWAIASSTCGRIRNLNMEELQILRDEEQEARTGQVPWQEREPREVDGHRPAPWRGQVLREGRDGGLQRYANRGGRRREYYAEPFRSGTLGISKGKDKSKGNSKGKRKGKGNESHKGKDTK